MNPVENELRRDLAGTSAALNAERTKSAMLLNACQFASLLDLAADCIKKARQGDEKALVVIDIITLKHAAQIARDAVNHAKR